jgi:hypothetical protein
MMGPADALAWAKRPQSREAIANIRELSRKDKRFMAIWEQLVADKIVTADGKPLALWDGKQWSDLQ